MSATEDMRGYNRTVAGRRSRGRALVGFGRVLLSDKVAAVAAGVIAVCVILSLFPAAFAPYSPSQPDFVPLLAPSHTHPFGTDALGRDILSRVIYGTRVSLVFGVVAAGISLIIGATLGLVAGYVGGWVDHVLSRLFEIVLMIPAFFLLVIIVAFFGNSVRLEVLVVGMTLWPVNARLMRASVLSLRERPFVRAAVATGATPTRVMFVHVMPNAIQPVIVNSNLQIGQAILFEAGMSFLGLGDPNIISWGQMVSEGAYQLTTAWWVAFFPGVALIVVILSFNLLGDAIARLYNLSIVQPRPVAQEAN